MGIALEACRSALQPSWSVFGTVLERLGPSWKRLGASLETSLQRLGGLEASWRHPGAWFFKDVKVIKKSMIFNNWRRFVFKGCIKRFNGF